MDNTPFPTENVFHFCLPTSFSLKNGHVPQKLFFMVILDTAFFEKTFVR